MAVKVSVITPVRAKTDLDIKWLGQAVESVKAQTFPDWEMVIVNDHSEVSLKSLSGHFKDERVRGAGGKNRGVCHARNQAVAESVGELIIGLDADDLFLANTLADLVEAYEKDRVVYGSCIVMTKDAQKVYHPPEYNFDIILRSMIMPIGSLHAKSDWEKVGGWDPRMEGGLEDWEYWIKLGEAGVCGKKVQAITYKYRRRVGSRISGLHSKPNAFTEALHRMRQLHLKTYNGDRPVSCCGGGSSVQPSISRATAQPIGDLRVPIESVDSKGIAKVRYTGGMAGGFGIVGDVSGFRYNIPGPLQMLEMPDGRVGVDKRDIPFLMRVNRGRDFEVVG